MTPKTIVQKIWDRHVVTSEPTYPTLMYIDLHLLHELTSPQAFAGLRERGIGVRRPDLTVATTDHSTPTTPRHVPIRDPLVAAQVAELERNCAEFEIPCFGLDHQSHGIVHVIGPELGLTHPGMTIVCGDSHTSTLGAVGALAFGIGTTEVQQVLATQCLLQTPFKTFRLNIEGRLSPGVSAKDVALAIIAEIGFDGATGYVLEYAGSAVAAMSMEERMTLCNMSIEAGAKAGLVAPDETTFAYLAGRSFSPKGIRWDQAVAQWSELPSDSGARYDRELTLSAESIEPMITFGTNPSMGIPITGKVPAAADESATTLSSALQYMGLKAGQPMIGHPIDVVFIGSCANSRISDLRAAAQIIKGKTIHQSVRMLVVPGSRQIKEQAVREGLADVFLAAGAEFRESGCSMCVAVNGDSVGPGQYCVSTSNRNFEGRQGSGARTFLASPQTAAASALAGCIADARNFH